MEKPAFVFDGRLLVDVEKLKGIGFQVCISYRSFELFAHSFQVVVIGRGERL